MHYGIMQINLEISTPLDEQNKLKLKKKNNLVYYSNQNSGDDIHILCVICNYNLSLHAADVLVSVKLHV